MGMLRLLGAEVRQAVAERDGDDRKLSVTVATGRLAAPYIAGCMDVIREKYPKQLLMADCSTVKEAQYADEIGFDFIGTTMVGYTKQSQGDRIEEEDFRIIREILETVKHPVIAEGNINTPEKAKRVKELGVFSTVVGSVITRPQLITRSFVDALHK